jgi:hypothetical protein
MQSSEVEIDEPDSMTCIWSDCKKMQNAVSKQSRNSLYQPVVLTSYLQPFRAQIMT